MKDRIEIHYDCCEIFNNNHNIGGLYDRIGWWNLLKATEHGISFPNLNAKENTTLYNKIRKDLIDKAKQLNK